MNYTESFLAHRLHRLIRLYREVPISIRDRLI